MKFSGKVLVVDDEAHIRKYIGQILKQFGTPSISEAADGDEAIAAYQKERPDLVLLDVNMPYKDGLDALRELRAIDREPVIVMLTSLTNRQTVEESLALGADNYIRKDTPKEEIVEALRAIIAESFGKA
jgi:two-component system, chemotaxis family, chemotaxis protein CheY